MSEEDKVFAEEVEPGANSRRDFLKKSLAVGGALWAAPAIASLPSGAAFGQTGSPQPGQCPGECSGTAFGVFVPLLSAGPFPATAGVCGPTAPVQFEEDNCELSLGLGDDPTVPGNSGLTAQLACGCVAFEDTADSDTCTAHGSVAGVNGRLSPDGDPMTPDLHVTSTTLASSTSQSCPSCDTSRASTVETLAITFPDGTTVPVAVTPGANSTIIVDGFRAVVNEQGCTASGNPFTAALSVYNDTSPLLPTGLLMQFGYSEAGASDCDCPPAPAPTPFP